MQLLLREAIRKSGGDDSQFFQAAYWWKFRQHINVWGDILAYRPQQKIPDYVVQVLHDKEDHGG